MPKFLVQASYTPEGTRGVLKAGGSSRRAAVQDAVRGLEGKIESFYFSFGDDDAFVILDLPNLQTAAAISMAVTASGAARVKTTVLLTPEEIDQAARTPVHYRAPGQ